MFPSLMTEINFMFSTAIASSLLFLALGMFLEAFQKKQRLDKIFGLFYVCLGGYLLYANLKFYEDLATGVPIDAEKLSLLASGKPILYFFGAIVGYYAVMLALLLILDKFFTFDTPWSMFKRKTRKWRTAWSS